MPRAVHPCGVSVTDACEVDHYPLLRGSRFRRWCQGTAGPRQGQAGRAVTHTGASSLRFSALGCPGGAWEELCARTPPPLALVPTTARDLPSVGAGAGDRALTCHFPLVRTEENPKQHIPLDEYVANLRSMVQYLRSVDVPEGRIVLITPPPLCEAAWERECLAQGRAWAAWGPAGALPPRAPGSTARATPGTSAWESEPALPSWAAGLAFAACQCPLPRCPQPELCAEGWAATQNSLGPAWRGLRLSLCALATGPPAGVFLTPSSGRCLAHCCLWSLVLCHL